MNTLLLFIGVAVLGHEVGWERLPDGGMEYVIQLDPAAIDALRRGQSIHSDILSAAGEVRAYRIVLGAGRLRRDAPLPRPAPKPASPQSPQQPAVAAAPETPWTLTLLGLFASLGVNVFLAWVVLGLRRRCRAAQE
jgi:hypothetical protein